MSKKKTGCEVFCDSVLYSLWLLSLSGSMLVIFQKHLLIFRSTRKVSSLSAKSSTILLLSCYFYLPFDAQYVQSTIGLSSAFALKMFGRFAGKAK